MSPRTLWEASGPKLINRCAASTMSVGLKSIHIAENSSNLLMDWKSPKTSLKSRKTVSGMLGVSQKVLWALWEPSGPKLTDRCAASVMSVGLKSMHIAENSPLAKLSCFRLYAWTSGPPTSPMQRIYRSILVRKFLREPTGTFWDTPNIPDMVFRNFNFRLFRQFFEIFRVSVKFLQEFPDVHNKLSEGLKMEIMKTLIHLKH